MLLSITIKKIQRFLYPVVIIIFTFFMLSGCDFSKNFPQAEWLNLNNNEEVGRYFRKNDKIYVHVNGMIDEELKEVDSNSFQVNRKFSDFGRDKSHGWFIAVLLKLDLPSWQIISTNYHRDKNYVYNGSWPLPDADPKTFEIIPINSNESYGTYGKDKNYVYAQWNKLEGADPATFQILKGHFTKDKNHIYFLQKHLEEADPESFKILNDNIGKDKNAIFAQGIKLPNEADLSSIRIDNDGYIYDKNGRFFLDHGVWKRQNVSP